MNDSDVFQTRKGELMELMMIMRKRSMRPNVGDSVDDKRYNDKCYLEYTDWCGDFPFFCSTCEDKSS